MENLPSPVLVALLGIVMSVLWYLLKQKDDRQEATLKAQAERIKALEASEGNCSKVQAETAGAIRANTQAIETLWRKHDEDVKNLSAVELQLARDHYTRTDLDAKFDKLETTFKDGLEKLGGQVEQLTKAVIEHTAVDNRK